MHSKQHCFIFDERYERVVLKILSFWSPMKPVNVLTQRKEEKPYPQWQSLPHITDEPDEGLQEQKMP